MSNDLQLAKELPDLTDDAVPALPIAINPKSNCNNIALQHAVANPEKEEPVPIGASRLDFGFGELNVNQMKTQYAVLNKALDDRCEALTNAYAAQNEALPYLIKMQALLSQRGEERGKVNKEAGLPTWSQWVQGYARKVRTSVRTIQRRISEERNKTCPIAKQPNDNGHRPITVRVQKSELDCLYEVVSAAAPWASWDEKLNHAVKNVTSTMTADERCLRHIPALDAAIPPKGCFSIARSLANAVLNESPSMKKLAQELIASLPPGANERQPLLEGVELVKVMKPKAQGWTAERKAAHSERMKAAWNRKKVSTRSA